MRRPARALTTLFHLARHPLAAARGVRAALAAPSWLEGPRLRRLLGIDGVLPPDGPRLDSGGGPETPVEPPAGWRTSRRAAYLALRALARLPGDRWRYSCLYRSAASCLLLREYGVPAHVRVGTRPEGEGRDALPAHAWTVVGEAPVTRTERDLALFEPGRPDRDGGSGPAIELHGLVKRYPRRPSWRDIARLRLTGRESEVLRDVTCEVRRGELFGLLGPNGAGKTTLFKILSTLVEPDGGVARVLGSDVTREAGRVRRLLGSVPQDERSLYWRLSARENLELFMGLHGAAARGRPGLASRLLAIVGLEGEGPKIVGAFSSGMRQRLLIARALIGEPRVLLLDEPTRSLDPIAARDLRAFLRDELCRRLGLTVVLATHNPEEALELCDRVAILDRGRLVAVGSADELSRRHAENRWRLRARNLAPEALEACRSRGWLEDVRELGTDRLGWRRLELRVRGGEEGAAEVLAHLSARGTAVTAFEPVTPSLAELIERVLEPDPSGDGLPERRAAGAAP